jgi:hypothetical protein
MQSEGLQRCENGPRWRAEVWRAVREAIMYDSRPFFGCRLVPDERVSDPAIAGFEPFHLSQLSRRL